MNTEPQTPIDSVLPWTGERMVPNQSDIATELLHWQRYLFFRPWYEDRRVVDAASGEGYGSNYASVHAASVTGVDLSQEAVTHASKRYPSAEFVQGDVCVFDYSKADLVVSFETIEHLPEPERFLEALSACKGGIVISTPNRHYHSPGNILSAKPFNPFHTIEWTPEEFAALIEKSFAGRQVRFLSQEARWPGLIRPGLDPDAMYTIAVIDGWDLPVWPRLGIAIPTVDNPGGVNDTVISLTRCYPGEMEFAIVANGSRPNSVAALRALQAKLPHIVKVLESPVNEGYGAGANRGLDYLWQEAWYDLFGVVNDDVMPATDCTCEMVAAMRQLEDLGQKPGMIGPVSNIVHGEQQRDIGSFSDYAEMLQRAEVYHREHANTATQLAQIRGLYFLMTPECLSDVGGFDPRFRVGNHEDDDLNLRILLAGYTLWCAEGAFLYHEGSSTFRKLGVDYFANQERNQQLLLEKWGVASMEDLFGLVGSTAATTSPTFVPLSRQAPSSGHLARIHGQDVDLVHQASDVEFAAWVLQCLKEREDRLKVISALAA